MPSFLVSPVGILALEGDKNGLSGLRFAEDNLRHDKTSNLTNSPAIKLAAQQLEEYWSGKRRSFDVPLTLQGTAFQRKVWRQLQHLPWGTVCSYTELAHAIGRPTAVRAVAQAVGANPIAIILPCHRVVGKDRSLTGFAGGLARKKKLLAHEGWTIQAAGREERSRLASRSPNQAMGK